MLNENDKEKLFGRIKEICATSEFDIVDLKIRSNSPFTLEIVLDREGGITLDECSNMNRDISGWIESNGLFPAGYVVDVCSPGLDRELKSDNDFKWARGKEIEVFMRDPVDGMRSVKGELCMYEGRPDEIDVKQPDEEPVSIRKDNITKARLKVKI